MHVLLNILLETLTFGAEIIFLSRQRVFVVIIITQLVFSYLHCSAQRWTYQFRVAMFFFTYYETQLRIVSGNEMVALGRWMTYTVLLPFSSFVISVCKLGNPIDNLSCVFWPVSTEPFQSHFLDIAWKNMFEASSFIRQSNWQK